MSANQQTISEIREIYRKEVFHMLVALGCEEDQATLMMNENFDQINAYVGLNSAKAPIVTSMMAARLIKQRYEA